QRRHVVQQKRQRHRELSDLKKLSSSESPAGKYDGAVETTACAPATAAKFASATDSASELSVIPTSTGTRPFTWRQTCATNSRRTRELSDGPSPVDPKTNRPCTPPARMCSTSRSSPATSSASSSSSGLTIGGIMPRSGCASEEEA